MYTQKAALAELTANSASNCPAKSQVDESGATGVEVEAPIFDLGEYRYATNAGLPKSKIVENAANATGSNSRSIAGRITTHVTCPPGLEG